MERVWSTSRRGFSVRSILTFVLTVFITALLWVAFGNQAQTHAADPTGNWVGNSILYDGHSYNANTSATKNNTLGLPEGTPYYSYAPAASSGTGTQVKTVKAFVIYFTPGTDPPTATTATYVTYDYLPSKGYSNPNGKTALTMTPSVDKNPVSSCTVDGIGWIICPVTIFLAKGMDFIFGQITNFMAVQPVTVNNTSSSLYISWNIMRSIANIAFIIVFLIIIYSQLTNVAVSNYGIKKLLPRLIIAALLVNLSYTICSIAIDISNILGYSLQQIFVNIRANTYSITNDTWSAGTTAWTTATAAILSGVGIGVLVADPGVIFALIPIIVGLILTALIVLLILAARQAIIVILIIIAPLAFVAYLLPNTEQWFKKWRELFMTMLIFFPAISLVFGGSQLASSIILQNASSMMMIILGLAVQVAPLVITPIILKFSGGVLGKIGGIVNNPKKGIMDRTNAWTNKRRDRSRAAVLANQNTKNPFRRVAQRFAYNSRRVEKGTEQYKAQFEDWSSQRDVSSRKGQAIEAKTALAKLSTEESHHSMSQAMEEARAGSDAGLRRLRLEDSITVTERVRAQMNGTTVEEMRTSNYTIKRDENGKITNPNKYTKYAEAITKRAIHLDQGSRIIARATAAAQGLQQQYFSEALMASEMLQRQAGGIDPSGADSALASAINTVRESYGKSIAEARAINKHFNLSSDQRQAHALGKAFDPVMDAQGNVRTFGANSIFTREAAIEDQVATGTITQINEIVAASGASLGVFKTTISEAIAKNGLGAKTLYLGGKTIDDIAQGKITSTDDLTRIVLETIAKGKISEKDLASIDRDAVEIFASAAIAARNGQGPRIQDQTLAADLSRRTNEFSIVAQNTLTGDERVNVKPNSKDQIVRIAQISDPTFTPPQTNQRPPTPPAGTPAA